MTEVTPLFKIVGFTGTRKGATFNQKIKLFSVLDALRKEGAEEFHHGDCVGADYQAAQVAHYMGYKIVCHPPLNDRSRAFFEDNDILLPPKSYIKRNHDIVDASEVLIAVPETDHETLRSGTWATIRYAIKTQKNIVTVYP